MQIKRLHRLGGRSLLTAVKHQLKFLLSAAAQKLYNWHGKKGKRAFGHLVLASVVTSKSFTLSMVPEVPQ